MEPEREMSSNLRAVQRTRADLHQALVDVEEAISGPAVGREEQWTADVLKQLNALRTTIDEHIDASERVGGLYDEITARAPRLAAHIGRLQAEHPTMRDGATELIAKLEGTPVGTGWPLDEARDEMQRLLGLIVRHRQHGADLVWEAYNVDIGGHES
jgi:hypothetical protein